MDDTRIPKQAYNRELKERDKLHNWSRGIQSILENSGFSEVWMAQGVIYRHSFLKQLKNRLIDIFKQDWYMNLRVSDRYVTYRQIKSDFEQENYIKWLDIGKYRQSMARLRIGACDLNINKRYTLESPTLTCPFCKVPETEMHFLLFCPKHQLLRDKYLSKFFKWPLNTTLNSLLHNSDKETTRGVAMYTYHALKNRLDKLQSPANN